MNKAIIFDTETTGLTEPRIIEAAWLSVPEPTSLEVTDEFCQRYNPAKEIDYGALATHHIHGSELVDCPHYTNFKLPLELEYMIGHSVDFDWTAAGGPSVKRICTLALSRVLWPTLDSHKQGAVLYFLKGAEAKELLMGAHSALGDVKICLVILREILKAIGNPSTWEEVWMISEAARIPTVMPFGKHKGEPIKSIPADYKSWLLRQPDVDQYLTIALKA